MNPFSAGPRKAGRPGRAADAVVTQSGGSDASGAAGGLSGSPPRPPGAPWLSAGCRNPHVPDDVVWPGQRARQSRGCGAAWGCGSSLRGLAVVSCVAPAPPRPGQRRAVGLAVLAAVRTLRPGLTCLQGPDTAVGNTPEPFPHPLLYLSASVSGKTAVLRLIIKTHQRDELF